MIKTELGYIHQSPFMVKDRRSNEDKYADSLLKQAEASVVSAHSKRARNIRRLIKYCISLSGVVGTIVALNKGFLTGIAMDLMWKGFWSQWF